MSEFKGTKGKWYFNNDIQVHSGYRIVTCNGVKIHESSNKNGISEKEIEANALLISKAPEMLEMLKESTEVIKWYMDNSTSELSEPFFNIGANQIEQIEQLIKEATEL